MDAIRAVVAAVAPKAVNVLIGPTKPVTLAELGAAGVRRVSVGGALYRSALTSLVATARALREGDLSVFSGAISGSEISGLLPKA
jgi:2-methylisocitrate lyase-like PEP mutase family enzyme